MLNFSIPTFVLVIFNMLILYFFLRFFLFKRVTSFMEERSKKISDSIGNAEKNLRDSETIKAEYEAKLREAIDESAKLVQEGREKASREYEKILAQAKKDAELLVENTRVKLEQEKQQILVSMKKQAASLVLMAASKIIEENLDNNKNRVLVEKVIDEVGA